MKIIITGRGVKVTNAIRKKLREMLSKHSKFLKKANKVDVELKESIAHGGVDSDLEVEITIAIHGVVIRVEEKGSDFYTIVDQIDPVLRRRLVRYRENREKWEGRKSWKLADVRRFEEELKEVSENVYADSVDVPLQITRYKQFSCNSPMHPAEAIERMELFGHEAFLFKNVKNGKYSVVYKRRDGTYGLVEPKDG